MKLISKLKGILGRSDDLSPTARRAPAPSTPVSAERGQEKPPPLVIREISPADFAAARAAGEEIVLLDVRMPWDHERQHPAGSLSLPLNELPQHLDQLDRSKHYVLSCYHGYSSRDGVGYLVENGFEKVSNLSGGFSGWAAAGLPIEPE